MSDEKESYSWSIKLTTLEKKINALSKENEHLTGQIEWQLKLKIKWISMLRRPCQIKAKELEIQT